MYRRKCIFFDIFIETLLFVLFFHSSHTKSLWNFWNRFLIFFYMCGWVLCVKYFLGPWITYCNKTFGFEFVFYMHISCYVYRWNFFKSWNYYFLWAVFRSRFPVYFKMMCMGGIRCHFFKLDHDVYIMCG